MKKIGSYLKSRGRYFIFYILLMGIFQCILYLYNVRQDALDYAVLLSVVLLVWAVILDYFLYCRHLSRVEAALKACPHELKVMPSSGELTGSLYQEKLRQLFHCKEELETDSRIARQEMLDYYGLWVHQIKTPISAMQLLLQSFDEGEIEEPDMGFIRPMKMELFKTEQYVEMVLSYLRMEDMSSDLALQWYEIDNIVRQAVRKYSQLFILKKIHLDYHKCEGMVLTDEKWLLLVIEQLLSNALKYTHEGTISIYMESGVEGVLVIEDTGIGIQSEDLPRIFEKGFTGYNGRRDKKSTGIGLYLCKSVCTKLNHNISLESEAGKGTKASLDLHRKVTRIE
ncbi:MAG: sensor histidine kinase [Muricomes sp.]